MLRLLPIYQLFMPLSIQALQLSFTFISNSLFILSVCLTENLSSVLGERFSMFILSYYKSYILRLSSRLSNLYSFHTFASSFQLLIIVKFYRLQI